MRRSLLLLMFAVAINAQTPPAFEVATIRPTAGPIPGVPPGFGQQRTTADTLTSRHTALIEIIRRAFGSEPEFAKGLDWAREERFDIVAKSAAPATDAQLWAMVQPLLEQRFKLKYHREPREVSGLAMVIGKNGPKLTPSEGGSNNLAMGNGILTGHNVTLSRLAGLLTTIMRTPVRDETGLTGTYDFILDPREYQGSPIPAMIQEALGLKLESKKFQVDVLVIDHIERPDDN
jgi:uncharacterized protein (TIGR03435 family)